MRTQNFNQIAHTHTHYDDGYYYGYIIFLYRSISLLTLTALCSTIANIKPLNRNSNRNPNSLTNYIYIYIVTLSPKLSVFFFFASKCQLARSVLLTPLQPTTIPPYTVDLTPKLAVLNPMRPGRLNARQHTDTSDVLRRSKCIVIVGWMSVDLHYIRCVTRP